MTDKTKEAPARSALKLALEALERAIPHKKIKGDDDYLEGAWRFHNKAIAALQEALINHSTQQEWKHVPYDPSTDMQEQGSIASGYDLSQARAKKVYQAMIDMHDVNVEREALAKKFSRAEQPAIPTVITCPFCESEHVPGWLHDYNMDRGAHGEQPAQPQQEPVACANGCRGFVKHHPPAQRQARSADTWVGLTANEVEEIFQKKLGYYPTIYAVEAKLKAKNSP